MAENFFEGFLQWDALKVGNVALNVLLVLAGPCLLYTVVWYERYGADLMYRTLINQVGFFEAVKK
jgi:hypothetical protein